MNTKPFITVLFMCATSFGAFSQFYADAFDRQYLTSDPTGNGTSILSGRYTSSVDYELEIGNGQGTYQTLTGPILQALLLMYKATDDISYLNQFTINSKHVQDHRDDKMQGSNSGPSFPVFDPDDASVIYDYWNAGVSNPRPMAPTWSIFMPVGEHLKWYASAVYSGEILFPMAQFVRLIQVENPSLASVACPVSGFATMGSYANWLETQIWLTIDAHSDAGFDQVNTNATRDIYKYFGLSWGFYKGISSGTPVEHNFATSMGRVFVTLFDCSTSVAVKNRLRGYLEVLKSNWILKAELEAYGWDGYNWSHKQNGTGGDEEVSHGAYAMHMALLCYQYGIMDSYGFPIYPEPMIRKLVNTFVRNMYNAPLNIGPGVTGLDYDCQDCDGSADFADRQMRSCGTWLPLSNTGALYDSYIDYTDRDIYNMTADFLLKRIMGPGVHDGLKWTGSLPVSLANQAYYYEHNQEILDPISVNRSPGNGSLWAGVEGGDIDNDGKDDIVGVRNSTVGAQIVITTVEPNQDDAYIDEIVSLAGATTGVLNYVDVAVGNFNPAHLGDEIVSLTNLNGHILLHQYNGSSTLSQQTAYTATSSLTDWRGVASGDFIKGNGKDEFVAVRNSDGKFILFSYNPTTNTISIELQWNSPVANYNWTKIAGGDIDGDGHKDDIVAIDNNQGYVYTFYYNDATNAFISGPVYTAPNPASNFTDVTCGKFCSGNQRMDDIILHRKLDGDLFGIRVKDGVFENSGESFFLDTDKMDVWGTGNFKTVNSKSELTALRNIDGDIFAFHVRLDCTGVPIVVGPGPIDPRKEVRNGAFENNTDNEDIRLFPNPTQENFEVRGLKDIKKIEIIDLFGNVIKTSENTAFGEVSDLPAGTYVVRIMNDQITIVKRLVKP